MFACLISNGDDITNLPNDKIKTAYHNQQKNVSQVPRKTVIFSSPSSISSILKDIIELI